MGDGLLTDQEIQMYKNIRGKDPQAIGNIILNLSGCTFCQAMGICKKNENMSCTEFIDNFIKNYN